MVLDTIVNLLADISESIGGFFDRSAQKEAEEATTAVLALLRGEDVEVTDPETGETRTTNITEIKDGVEGVTTDILGEIPEEAQELILQEIEPKDIPEDTDVREAIGSAEGAAVTQSVAAIAASLSIEAVPGADLDSQQFVVSQLLTFLALEDILGLELQATTELGVLPPLERQINREYRAKNADLQDKVEEQLRNKDQDEDYLDGIDIYGIRDEDVGLLEEVAIRSLEPEELIETPAEAGIVPDDGLLEEELDRAGISEGAKELFQETVQEIPKTTRIYEERIRAEELVNQLDELVAAEEITPNEAINQLGFLNDEAQLELRDRFRDLRDLPSGPPTRSQVESGFQNGLIGIDRFTSLLETVDVDPAEHPYVEQEAILAEIDGDLRQALGLGYITEGEYQELADTAGLDAETISSLLDGEDLDDIAESNLQDKVDSGTLAVDTVSGIGENRRSALEAGQIGTVGVLANADPAEVARLANVTEDTAADFISSAELLTGGNS
jgi:hypothetical protein